jgi:hypothetical protein
MSPHLRLCAPLVLALALPTDRGPAPDEPAFAPGAHAILTKSFTEQTTLEIDAFEVRVNGETLEQDPADVRLETVRRVRFTDEYAEVEAGRILDLLRTFDQIGADVQVAVELGESEEHALELESELEGAVVRFEWDADEGEYLRSFEEGGTGDDEHLAALELDADLVGFLPTEPIEVDDTWEVDPVHLGRAFAPSGDLRLVADSLGSEPYRLLDREAMLGALQTALGATDDAWEGEVSARYAGAGEVDGVQVGTIALEIDVTCEARQLDRLRRMIEHLGLGSGEDFSDLTLEWRAVGTGELLWNLERGHVHAFHAEVDLTVEAHLAQTQSFGEQEVEIEGFYELSGRAAVTLETE